MFGWNFYVFLSLKLDVRLNQLPIKDPSYLLNYKILSPWTSSLYFYILFKGGPNQTLV